MSSLYLTNEDYYLTYKTGDKFLEEFVGFSIKNREKFHIGKTDALWPLSQLYNLLKNERGGFILDLGQHACLGITVESTEDEGWFNVAYRDPFHPENRSIKVNSRNLRTNEDKIVKIQWFGKFKFLESTGEQPGFTVLSKYKYKMILPSSHTKLIQKNSFLCGDISAFLASKANIKYSVKAN